MRISIPDEAAYYEATGEPSRTFSRRTFIERRPNTPLRIQLKFHQTTNEGFYFCWPDHLLDPGVVERIGQGKGRVRMFHSIGDLLIREGSFLETIDDIWAFEKRGGGQGIVPVRLATQ